MQANLRCPHAKGLTLSGSHLKKKTPRSTQKGRYRDYRDGPKGVGKVTLPPGQTLPGNLQQNTWYGDSQLDRDPSPPNVLNCQKYALVSLIS